MEDRELREKQRGSWAGPVILVSGMVALNSAAWADARPSPCPAIRATYLKRYAAYSRRDLAGYMALYASDYRGTDTGSKNVSTRASIRADVAKTFSHPERFYRSPYQVEYRIIHCRQVGGLAYVDAEAALRCAVYKPHTTQVIRYYSRDFKQKDVWQERSGFWALKSDLITSHHRTPPQPRKHP